MSTLEDRLRDAFRADAETVRPEAIPGPPAPPARPWRRWSGSGRARVLIPLAAAAAVVAIVAGLSLATPLSGGREQPPAPLPTAGSGRAAPVPVPTLGAQASRGVAVAASAPGTPPHFYVAFGGGPLTVRDTLTGKIVGRVSAPPGSSGFATVAAAGGRTFVAVVFYSGPCVSQLWQFRLNSSGQPGPLTPLNITVPGNFAEVHTLAVTPDGRTIAYDTLMCGFPAKGEIGVINLATREVKVWTTSGNDSTWALSISADSRLLAFGYESGGAVVLRTSSPEGPVTRRGQVVSRVAGWAALSGDGTSLYDCTVSPGSVPGPKVGAVTYDVLSLATGRGRVIAHWSGLPYPQCWASLDPSGRYLLVQYPVSVPSATDWARPVILDIRSGQVTNIPAPAFYAPLDIAW